MHLNGGDSSVCIPPEHKVGAASLLFLPVDLSLSVLSPASQCEISLYLVFIGNIFIYHSPKVLYAKGGKKQNSFHC